MGEGVRKIRTSRTALGYNEGSLGHQIIHAWKEERKEGRLVSMTMVIGCHSQQPKRSSPAKGGDAGMSPQTLSSTTESHPSTSLRILGKEREKPLNWRER